jgi:hypothetical protein
MRIVRDPRQVETAFQLAQVALNDGFYPPFACVAVEDDAGTIRGAAIFNDFAEKNIELTCVGPGAFTRDVRRELAHIAFNVNGCNRVTIRTAKSNQRLVRAAVRWGWKIEGLLRRWYEGDDAVVLGMLREECPFLNEKVN